MKSLPKSTLALAIRPRPPVVEPLLAILFAESTAVLHWGYYFSSNPYWFFNWMCGVNTLVTAFVLMHAVLHRWKSPTAAAVMFCALFASIEQSILSTACGGYLTFFYDGPTVRVDKCEAAFGFSFAKAELYGIILTIAIMLPTIWKNKWGRLGTEHT